MRKKIGQRMEGPLGPVAVDVLAGITVSPPGLSRRLGRLGRDDRLAAPDRSQRQGAHQRRQRHVRLDRRELHFPPLGRRDHHPETDRPLAGGSGFFLQALCFLVASTILRLCWYIKDDIKRSGFSRQ